jgi:Uma2 family endonuclease
MGRVSLPHIRFTVDELFRLVEADALGTTRVELINGRIFRMAPQGGSHMAAISRGAKALLRVAGLSEWVILQGTLILNRYSAPDPDILWLPVPEGTPVHEWPDPILLIEVSDTSYRKDTGIKLRTYAFHGIPEYWIENLQAERIEVYRQPQNPTARLRDCHYASVEYFGRGRSIAVAARPGVMLAVDELLPPPDRAISSDGT